MEFSIKAGAAEKQKSDCIVLGVFAGRELSEAAALVDRAAGGTLAEALTDGDMEGRAGSTLMLRKVPGVAATRVLLVGLGASAEFDAHAYREAVQHAVAALRGGGSTDCVLYLAELAVKDCDLPRRIRLAVSTAAEATYRFDRLKSKKDEDRTRLAKITLGLSAKPDAAANRALAQGEALGAGVKLARDLGNLPSNICTPSFLAKQAQELADEFKLKCQVLEEKDMEKLGMGSLLSVTRGSREPAKLIVLEYNGGPKKQKPTVLVGKGITFDTGGISIKPAPDMDEMKFDMSGAGSVLGTLRAVAGMGLPVNVVGIIPTCENMPDGSAVKPGDIVTSMSGLTIEILNTDAEGRLILCDALTYAKRFNPDGMIDIATLTGACVVALGHVASGLYSNDDAFAAEVLDAGQASLDRAWRMPLWQDYQEQLKSPFADLANIGGRAAGSVTAACFLARFVDKTTPWVHLDIAGVAYRSGKQKGSTGRPVPMLTEYLLKRAGQG